MLLGDKDNKQNNVKRQAREQLIIRFMVNNINERANKSNYKTNAGMSQHASSNNSKHAKKN